MKRITFRFSSAQYLAVRVKKQLADDDRDRYPKAAVIAKQDFYVDVTGASTLDEAAELQTKLTNLLSGGGFPLRQWSSNCPGLTANVPSKHRENKSFDFEQPTDQLHTTRLILSDIAKIYDPPGWLAPVVISAKLLLKRFWILGKNWDDPLPNEIVEFWSESRNNLRAIKQTSIPRRKMYHAWVTRLFGCVGKWLCSCRLLPFSRFGVSATGIITSFGIVWCRSISKTDEARPRLHAN